MPTYNFVNTETNETEVIFLKMSELDDYKKAHPHMKQQLAVPAIGDPVRLGITRPSDGMNELIKHAKKSHHGSTIQTRN
tara:strand:+ start:19493 stop:19729 length:237 start_codon:yes stop_codon:yes gene_type:complete